MDKQTIIFLVAGIAMVVFGPLTARSSMKREKIFGGPVAQFFNLIGTIAFVGLVPGVLCALVLGQASHTGLPLGLTLLATSLVAFLIFALFELPARKANLSKVIEEDVWTEEKARTSKL